MQVDTTSTPGKRALLDLSILLDTLELAHPDIVEGWLARIRTALDNAVELLAAAQAVASELNAEASAQGCSWDSLEALNIAIANATAPLGAG